MISPDRLALDRADWEDQPGPEELEIKRGQKPRAEQVVLTLHQIEVQEIFTSFKEAQTVIGLLQVVDTRVRPHSSHGSPPCRIKWALPAKLYALTTGRPVLRGASLSTVAVLRGGRIIGDMHLPDEPVHHRVLDHVGDQPLAGYAILAHVTAAHTGPELIHVLMAKLLREPSAWDLV